MSIDIFCKGGSCPLKHTCKRYKASVNKLEWRFLHIHYDDNKKECRTYLRKRLKNGINK